MAQLYLRHYFYIKEKIMNRMTEAYCSNCQSSKSFSNFHNHVVIGKKYLPMCKTCCNKRIKEYIQKLGNDGAALWCLLAELGIPFLREVWEPTQKIIFNSTNVGRKPDLLLTYLRTIKELGIVVEGFWQSDIMLDDLIDINKKEKQEIKEVIDWYEQINIWGKFLKEDGSIDEEAYNYLNFTFSDYTKDLLEMDANLIRRYRDLAKAELRKRKADESGDIQEIAKAQDNLKKMLDMLNLSDFKKNESDERKQFIDRIAWMIEETEPAEEEDESKYRDIAGYEKIYDSFMRSMRNILTGDRNYPDIPPEGQ